MSSRRELIAVDVVEQLRSADSPRFGLATRENFDYTQLSRQQFPAIWVSTSDEQRQDLTQRGKSGLREGRLQLTLVGYVSGHDVDSLRNDLIERVEEVLDDDRTRDGRAYSTQLIEITVDAATPEPYGRVEMLVEVVYTYQRGQA